MSVRVDDYSTDTGLRVRISCDTTGTTIQIPADEWRKFLIDVKEGQFEGLALKPKKPFIY